MSGPFQSAPQYVSGRNLQQTKIELDDRLDDRSRIDARMQHARTHTNAGHIHMRTHRQLKGRDKPTTSAKQQT